MSTQKFKSDGGSSDYYKIQITFEEKDPISGLVTQKTATVEMGDIIYATVGGDFDLGNIIKACRRMYLDSKGGGKEGIDAQYDANKIKWFVDDYVKRISKPKHFATIHQPTLEKFPQVRLGDSDVQLQGHIHGDGRCEGQLYTVQGSSIKPV